MVKLTGPHFSITALGKFGKVTVYSIWKGIQYARMLITPTNPQSGSQGDRRVMLGGLGRSPKYVQVDSDYYSYAKEVAPAGQSWISWYVDYIMTTYFDSVANFDAHHTEFDTHINKGDWDTKAAALGLLTFDLAYKSMTYGFAYGHMLYCLAKFGCDQYLLDNEKFNAAPYTKALATWDGNDIDLMTADFLP